MTVDDHGIKWIYARQAGGTMWHSVTWGNGVNRNVSDVCGTDPSDSALKHTGGGGSTCNINGAGVMRVTEGGRISIHRNVQNCEATVYVRYPSSADGNIHLQPKTEHYCLGSGDGPGGTQDHDLFGGYILYIDQANQSLYFKKEQSHNIGYSPREGEVAQSWAANTWMGVKAICYNSGSNVILEAWVDTTGGSAGGNWIRKIRITDNGTWSMGGSTYPPTTGMMREGAFRTDNSAAGSYFEGKWMSFREIIPGQLDVAPTPPPPSPPPPSPTPTPTPTPTPPPPSGPGDFQDRKYTFTIDTSVDNQNWVQQFEGDSESNGDTLMEFYNFTDVDARFIRINVLANDKSAFAGINEASIFGFATPIGTPLPPIPTPNPSPQFKYNWFRHGYHVNYGGEDVCGDND